MTTTLLAFQKIPCLISCFQRMNFEKILSPVSRMLIFVFVLALLGEGKLLTRGRTSLSIRMSGFQSNSSFCCY
jgi:hypothetical protein